MSTWKTYSELSQIGLGLNPSQLTTIFKVEETSLTQSKLNAIAFPSLIARSLIVLKWKDETPSITLTG